MTKLSDITDADKAMLFLYATKPALPKPEQERILATLTGWTLEKVQEVFASLAKEGLAKTGEIGKED